MRILLLTLGVMGASPASHATTPLEAPPGFPKDLATTDNLELMWDWHHVVVLRWYASMEHWCYATDRLPPVPDVRDERAASQRRRIVAMFGEKPVAIYEQYQVVALDCRPTKQPHRYRNSFAAALERVDDRLSRQKRGPSKQ